MARDDFQKPPRFIRILSAVEQRLHISAHGGQRRAQFVRDVGDEIPSDAIGAPQIGDVVQHDHRAQTGCAGDRRAASDDRQIRHRQLEPGPGSAFQCAADLRRDIRLAHDFQIVTSLRRPVDAQHVSGSGIHELKSSLIVDDQHAFFHARENGFHSRAIRGQGGRAPADLAHGVVQRAGHHSDLVRAVVARRPREVSRRVTLGHVSDSADALGEESGRRPGEQQCGNESHERGSDRGLAYGLQLIADVGKWEREPDLRQLRYRRVLHRNGDIEHVGADRGAVPARDSEAVACRLNDFRTAGVIFGGTQRRRRQLRVADDPAVGSNEGHASRHQPSEIIGLGVELLGRGRTAVRQRFRRQARLRYQRLLDALIDRRSHVIGEQSNGDAERDRHRQQRRGEHARAEGHGDDGFFTFRLGGQPACSRTA